MRALDRMGVAMAGLLVGLGIAVTAKAFATVGVDHLVLGHIVGPGLVLAGLLRMRLQRAMSRPNSPGGDDGRAS
jgi:hypothetical protein